MRLVAIICWGLMILAKTWSDCASNFSFGDSSGGFGSGGLVSWILLLILFMCTFSVDMDGKRCFMNPTVRLVHVVKWNFLMDRRRVFRTRLNSVA